MTGLNDKANYYTFSRHQQYVFIINILRMETQIGETEANQISEYIFNHSYKLPTTEIYFSKDYDLFVKLPKNNAI